MKRELNDWLTSYVEYTRGTEAPKIMHFFAGVSAIAGALRRKVWIDNIRFKWFPSFYIVFVADPGIVSKSSTSDIAMDLLREVPGIHFGPDSVTWQSLVTSFAASCESFEYDGDFHPMSAFTLASSEFGSLMDLSNQDMVNLFIELWDGKKKYDKQTKMSGCDVIEAPWINLLACTTPSWVTTNMSHLATAGGLTSRTLYVFGEAKETLVAQPRKAAPAGVADLRGTLIRDLERISVNLCGPFTFTQEAEEWEVEWYRKLWTDEYRAELPDWHKGYLARKQTYLNKLAMIMSVSRGDSLEIALQDYQLAEMMLATLEIDLPKIFSLVGKSEEAIQAERLIAFVRRHGEVSYDSCYRVLHATFPDARDFEGIVSGAVRAGYVMISQKGTPPVVCLKALNPED
jgi:hypothetical protein